MHPQNRILPDSKDCKPQDSKVLKSLRNRKGLTQEAMASALTEAFQQATGIKHYIHQPDVCRLEKELSQAPIDVFKLMAYSYLCNVDIAYLLCPEYKKLLHNASNDMQLKTFHTDTAAEQRMFELEKKKRTLISPVFPSSFFSIDKASERYQQLSSVDYETNELYPIDAFISFLFSPVARYTLNDKKTILETYIDYFQHNNFRQLNFFMRSDLPEHAQLTCMELLPEQKTLLIPGPLAHYGEGDTFIEIHDQNIYNSVTDFYRKIRTFENNLIYLRIGLAALDQMRDGRPAREAINSFAREILLTPDANAAEAINCFSPEIQDMINQ